MAVLVGTLIAGQGRVEASLVDAILGALAAVARDDEGRVAIQEAGGIPLIIKLMDGGPDMVRHGWWPMPCLLPGAEHKQPKMLSKFSRKFCNSH